MLIKFKHLNLGYFVYNSAFLAPLMKIRQSGSSWPGTLWMGITGPAPRCSELFCSLCKPKAALVAVLFHWCLTEPASLALVHSVSSRFYHPVFVSHLASAPFILAALSPSVHLTIHRSLTSWNSRLVRHRWEIHHFFLVSSGHTSNFTCPDQIFSLQYSLSSWAPLFIFPRQAHLVSWIKLFFIQDGFPSLQL